MSKATWDWKNDYGVYRARIGLMHLVVTEWGNTGWYVNCIIGPLPDARDRHLLFEFNKPHRTLEAAQRRAEKLAPELLLGAHLAFVGLMKSVGVEIPTEDDPDIREVGNGGDGEG